MSTLSKFQKWMAIMYLIKDLRIIAVYGDNTDRNLWKWASVLGKKYATNFKYFNKRDQTSSSQFKFGVGNGTYAPGWQSKRYLAVNRYKVVIYCHKFHENQSHKYNVKMKYFSFIWWWGVELVILSATGKKKDLQHWQ